MKLYFWTMNSRYDVDILELTRDDKRLTDVFLNGSFDGMAYTSIINLSNKKLLNILSDCPSTNGLYLVPGFLDSDAYYDNTSIGDHKSVKNTMFLISTDQFFELYQNDVYISTTSADRKHFYQSKRVHPKLFVKKHLLKMKVPSKHNKSHPSHKTINDIMYADFETMSVKDIKNILMSYGPVGAGNKDVLIERLIKTLQFGL